MGRFYKSHSKDSVCQCVLNCHTIILWFLRRDLGTALAADTVGSPGGFCFCFGLLKQHLTGDHARDSAAPGWHMQESTCTRRKPGMNHQVSRWDPAAFLTRCRNQRGGHFQPRKFLVAKCRLEMWVPMFGHALLWAPGTWQWECSKAWVGVLDALLPLPATFLYCTADPLLELALLLQREGAHLIPAVTAGSLCSPAKWHPASSSLLPQCLCTWDDELQLLPWSPQLCKNSTEWAVLRYWQR